MINRAVNPISPSSAVTAQTGRTRNFFWFKMFSMTLATISMDGKLWATGVT